MKRFHLRSISFITTAVYLLLTLSPLASLSSLSKPFFQALAKECSGDCRLCGCSTERSASRTCCCWQKKRAEAEKMRQFETNKSCSTAAASHAVEAAGSCCSKPSPKDDLENEIPPVAQADPPAGDATPSVSISTCPCGSGKDLAFFGGERSQHMPFRYLSGIPRQQVTQFSFLQPERLVSRSGEPPDPPPKLAIS